MTEIVTSKGYKILVDDADYEWLNQWKWAVNRGYATRRTTGKTIRMHRLVLGCKPDEFTDHINGDRLDNRRANLRVATMAQNNQNRPRKSGRSGYRGVHWHGSHYGWSVRLKANGKSYSCGMFRDPVAGAKAYDKKARELHGEFAVLNFPDPH